MTMTAININPYSLIVVIQIGICRYEQCNDKGSFGILDAICHGRDRCPQRIPKHTFDDLVNKHKRDLLGAIKRLIVLLSVN